MTKSFVVSFCIFICLAQVASAQNQTDYFGHLQSAHRKVLKDWLVKNKGMRPAVDADASKEYLEVWRRDIKDFFPYYVIGDFNGDDKEDFAVLLKIENKEDEGAIIVFNAPFSKPKPAYYNREFGVEEYYLEFMKDVKMLYCSKYETHGFYLKPMGKKYIEYDADEEVQ